MSGASPVERFLRQFEELAGPELYLDTMNRDEALLAFARAGRPGPAPEPVSTRTSAARSQAAAGKAAGSARKDLAELGRRAAACQLCRLHVSRQSVVFGEGSAGADLVVVGEAPGREEDRTGRPFVGRAGRLLDLLLMSVGFPREDVYICNVLKCRPPDNRNPLADEVDLCTTHYLHAQLETISPRALLAVGRFAVQALLGVDESIGRLRGRVHAYRGTPLIVSYHPAFLLRSPNMVRAAWSDLQLIRTVLDEPA